MRGILQTLGTYFDAPPAVRGAIQDQTDQRVQAFFEARLQGEPIAGLACLNLANGGGSITAIFDRPASLRTSFFRLAGTLESSQPAAPRQIQWRQAGNRDNSATFRVPADWSVGPGSGGDAPWRRMGREGRASSWDS